MNTPWTRHFHKRPGFYSPTLPFNPSPNAHFIITNRKKLTGKLIWEKSQYYWPFFFRYYIFKRLSLTDTVCFDYSNTGILFTFHMWSQSHKITQIPSHYRECYFYVGMLVHHEEINSLTERKNRHASWRKVLLYSALPFTN